MDENDAPPASPPLPKRGAYSIDFDSLDENTNPFATKSKVGLGSSPPINSSTPKKDFDESENAFKPRKALANSPPGSPKLLPHSNITTNTTDAEEVNNLNQSNGTTIHDDGNFSRNDREDNTSKEVSDPQTIPKKKKVIKKPKVQSKLKIPKKIAKQVEDISDEIQIFIPGVDLDNNNLVSKPAADQGDVNLGIENEFPAANDGEGEEPPLDAAPEAMASSMEADYRFVEGEEGDDGLVNEDFAAPHENYKDANDWSLPNHFGDMNNKDGEQHKTQDIDGKPANPSSDTTEDWKSSPSSDNAALRQKTSPPPSESVVEDSITRHPAVRALETAQAEESASGSGKKIATTMEKDLEGVKEDQNKGTVVQLVQVLRYSQSDWNKMKQELELNFQASLLNKERDWSLLLADRDKKVSTLNENSKKLKATNEDMRMVVTEFEKTISQLQADKEKSKSESHRTVYDMEQERDQALEDLQSVETAFSDLHRRYEKSKSIIEGFKRNEDQLKSCVEDMQAKLKKSETKLLSLRSQAEEKLDKANEDIDMIKKSTRSEVVRLEASLKKAELRNSSLEESLQRKEIENQELTAICDELIAKVGS